MIAAAATALLQRQSINLSDNINDSRDKFLGNAKNRTGGCWMRSEEKSDDCCSSNSIAADGSHNSQNKKVQTYFCGRFHPLFACLANGQLAREKFKQL